MHSYSPIGFDPEPIQLTTGSGFRRAGNGGSVRRSARVRQNEENSPPRMTTPMGAWISLRAARPASTSGNRRAAGAI